MKILINEFLTHQKVRKEYEESLKKTELNEREKEIRELSESDNWKLFEELTEKVAKRSQNDKDRRRRQFFLFIFIIGLITSLYYMISEETYEFIWYWYLVVARTCLIKLRPYWNWEQYSETTCLLNNPYYMPPNSITADTCKYCSNIRNVEYFVNVTSKDFNKLKDRHIPFVVKNVMTDWDFDVEQYTLPKFINNLKIEDPEVMSKLCRYYFRKERNPKNFPFNLDHLIENDPLYQKNVVMSFLFCDPQIVRHLRRTFQRPYFLPRNVQVAAQLEMVYGYNVKDIRVVEIGSTDIMSAYLQIKGSTVIELFAESFCDETCANPEDPLVIPMEAGDILIMTNLYHMACYPKRNDTESIGVVYSISQ
ncbi:hypothetical protein SNEBB_004067 [Seison nebaliae]|nr:hypothetical protein SNEBB_004067 [Seison nebaliae]